MIMIGIDPHKATHTAVAVDDHEVVLGELTVRASAVQADRLRRWADNFDDRRWAVEAANGLGYLVSQQLVAAGETVFDVPPVLASRVRILGSGKAQKNDPNDARSVAIAAIEASSGPKARHRLNPRGNRRLNWAIHTIAATQLRYDTAGRRFYDRKVAEGKTTKEALRALKRRLSDVVYRHLVADARRREQQP